MGYPVTTAAGPEIAVNPLLLAGGAGPEYVFFDPEIAGPGGDDPLVNGCQPGMPCGYATYYLLMSGSEDNVRAPEQGYRSSGFFVRRGVSSLTPVVAGFSMEGYTDSEQRIGRYDALGFTVASNSGDSRYVDLSSLPLDERMWLGSMVAHYGYDDDNLRLDGLTDTSIRCLGNCQGRFAPYMRLDYGHLGGLEGSNLSHGLWFSSAGGQEGGGTQTYLGSFVFGITSTLDDLTALQAELDAMNSFSELSSNLVAEYRGHSAWGAGVQLSVNFSNQTWGGSFNGGQDGQVMAYASENGTTIVGQVGFNIDGGTINGVNLNADSNALSALDGTVSGNVNASFFGDNAGEIGGVADIVKTQTVTQPSVVSENIAGYTDAVYVTTFSANLQIPKEKGI
ncbi:transferrin-binding protein-like solute binding protein [Neptuniibacter sp. 1_MG-2023]|uniref:transferrin-binding protein-like solute binding protein n=1 Tax=Neptuniibacter sp. 1_MG-2023 TaxID=3062662 RepID=UPI0026E13089|nr:transferrin-binding protein-like solute binding protein [Neptuniibacter sp. 1_MG-2023]MDO6592629.1 transferrin-binding protein-like solute binding protein [Neptuniibacter sp. 1_MG-2023]